MKKLRLVPNFGIPRLLRQLHLCHVDSLLASLSLMRSKRMIHHKQDPFNVVRSDFHEVLPKEMGGAVAVLLKHTM